MEHVTTQPFDSPYQGGEVTHQLRERIWLNPRRPRLICPPLTFLGHPRFGTRLSVANWVVGSTLLVPRRVGASPRLPCLLWFPTLASPALSAVLTFATMGPESLAWETKRPPDVGKNVFG